MYINNKTLILLLISLIIIIIIVTITKLFNDNDANKFTINNDDDDNCRILYDGKFLCYPARKKIKKNENATEVNCNSNLIDCRVDRECTATCLPLNYHTSKCITGFCHYIPTSKEKSLCQNGGQITSTFEYGRLLTSCICPENFIGLFCQTPNEMKPSYLRTFELVY